MRNYTQTRRKTINPLTNPLHQRDSSLIKFQTITCIISNSKRVNRFTMQQLCPLRNFHTFCFWKSIYPQLSSLSIYPINIQSGNVRIWPQPFQKKVHLMCKQTKFSIRQKVNSCHNYCHALVTFSEYICIYECDCPREKVKTKDEWKSSLFKYIISLKMGTWFGRCWAIWFWVKVPFWETSRNMTYRLSDLGEWNLGQNVGDKAKQMAYLE